MGARKLRGITWNYVELHGITWNYVEKTNSAKTSGRQGREEKSFSFRISLVFIFNLIILIIIPLKSF